MVNEGRKLRVGVIFGGRSGEHEVSLMSARSVLGALDRQKYEVIQIGVAPDGRWWMGEGILEALTAGESLTPFVSVSILPDPTQTSLFILNAAEPYPPVNLDVVFPVLHGTYGEDGTLQGVLELADIAYVGAGVLGSALGMDKAVFKDIMRSQNIPIVESMVVLSKEIEKMIEEVLDRAEQVAAYPLFVKPANLGSSVGISKCLNRSDLMEGLIEAACYDRKVIVERGLNAREIEVSVLGNDHPLASVPGEVVPSREFYSYEAKYIDGKSDLIIPAPLSTELTAKVQGLAVKAYRAIDCSGMARVDFLLDKAPTRGDGLYLSEINTIPGFTQISMYPKLWEASALPYPKLLDRLIELALERKADRDHIEHRLRRDH